MVGVRLGFEQHEEKAVKKNADRHHGEVVTALLGVLGSEATNEASYLSKSGHSVLYSCSHSPGKDQGIGRLGTPMLRGSW